MKVRELGQYTCHLIIMKHILTVKWDYKNCLYIFLMLEIRFIIVPHPLSNEIGLICCFTSVITIIPLLKCVVITRLTIQSSHCASKVVLRKLFELFFEIVVLIYWRSFKNKLNVAIVCDILVLLIEMLKFITSWILRFELNLVSFFDLFPDDMKTFNGLNNTLNGMSVMHMLSRKCYHPNRYCFHVLMLFDVIQ